MPTFLKDRKRNPWKGQVKRQGFRPEAAYFPTEDEAKEWEELRRGALRRKFKGMKADIADLQKITVGQMVEKYLKEETAHKACCIDETYRINIFLNYKDFKKRPLIAFTRPDAIEFRNYMEREYRWEGKPYIWKGRHITPRRKSVSLKPGSIRRYIAIFKDMWNIAANDWRGYESLKELGNPWIGVSSSKTTKKRTRRLNDIPSRKNELDRLLESCKRCFGLNKIYIPLAINLAVQTGMRLQEILYLKWNDIYFEAKTISIRKSKTDYKSDDEGRVIVLPVRCLMYLLETVPLLSPLPHTLPHGTYAKVASELLHSNKRIFPMTKSAFSQTWKRVTKDADIPSKEEDANNGIKESQCGLEFKDLRREAGSRFDEAGLTKAEHDLMLGHDSQEIRDIYIAPYLDRIREKLDNYWIKQDKYKDKVYQSAMKARLPPGQVMLNSLLASAGVNSQDIAALVKAADGQIMYGHKFVNEGGLLKLIPVGELEKKIEAETGEHPKIVKLKGR